MIHQKSNFTVNKTSCLRQPFGIYLYNVSDNQKISTRLYTLMSQVILEHVSAHGYSGDLQLGMQSKHITLETGASKQATAVFTAASLPSYIKHSPRNLALPRRAIPSNKQNINIHGLILRRLLNYVPWTDVRNLQFFQFLNYF